MSVEHILVMRAGGLGDLILTLPAIRAVRRRFPKAQIEVMGHTSTLAAISNTHADRVSSVDDHPGLERLFVRDAHLPKEIAAYISGFDLILWYGYDRDGVLRQNLRRVHRGCLLIAEPFPPAGERVHVSDHLLAALEPFAVSIDRSPPEIRATEFDRAEAAGWLDQYTSSSSLLFAIHPGSGSPAKNWPPDRYAALIRHLAIQPNTQIILLSGHADEETRHAVQTRIDGLDVLGLDALPLGVLTAVLERCALFVGNDSGVTHLAAAVGTPTIAIFGPTDPRMWAPRGKQVWVLQGEHPSCSPCTGPRARVTCSDRRCLDTIQVDDVLNAVHRACTAHTDSSSPQRELSGPSDVL